MGEVTVETRLRSLWRKHTQVSPIYQDEAIIAKINRAWLRANAGRAALREREG
jgi:hypothetical protein